MARYNAMEETFTEVRVLGKPALFHDLRIDRSTVPKGLYLYEVRHDDEGWGDPVQIAKGIMVNHFGSIITRELVLCQEKVQIKYALLMLSYPAKASALSSNAA